MATGRQRVAVLGVVTMFAAMACSGGFSGASTAPSAAPQASSEPSAEASASAAAAEPVTLTMMSGEVEATQTRVKALTDAYVALHPNVTSSSKPHRRVRKATTS